MNFMAIMKKPVKKMLFGLSLLLGLFVVLFVRVFGANPSNKAEFSRVSLLEMMGTLQAHADISGGGGGGVNDDDSGSGGGCGSDGGDGGGGSY